MTEKEAVTMLLNEGVDLQYGKLSLCDLHNYGIRKPHRRYQVHCEDRKLPFSQTYDELGPAVERFVYIKGRIGGRVR